MMNTANDARIQLRRRRLLRAGDPAFTGRRGPRPRGPAITSAPVGTGGSDGPPTRARPTGARPAVPLWLGTRARPGAAAPMEARPTVARPLLPPTEARPV